MSRRKTVAKLAFAGLVLLAALTVRPGEPYGLNDRGKALATLPGRALAAIYEPLGPVALVNMGPQATGAPITTEALAALAGVSQVLVDVPDLPASEGFVYQSAEDPRLAELRRRYALDAELADCANDLQVLTRLCTWTKSRWVFSADLTGPTLHVADALRLLSAAEGGERFHCAQYSYVLIQVLAAVGFTARCLRLESASGGVHSVVEAWSDDLQRWVVLDPSADVHYRRAGAPLNALELQRAWIAHEQVQLVAGPRVTYPGGEVHEPARALPPHDGLDLYARVAVCQRNDFLSRSYPMWHPSYFGNRWQGLWVPASEELYRPLNQTTVRLVRAEPEALELSLGTVTPNFAVFELRIDEGPWRATPATFRWELHAGPNRLAARARNTGGRVGRSASLAVQVAAR